MCQGRNDALFVGVTVAITGVSRRADAVSGLACSNRWNGGERLGVGDHCRGSSSSVQLAYLYKTLSSA